MSAHTPVTVTLGGGPVRLDWRLRHDEKSLAYTVASRLNMTKRVRTRRWKKSVVLDQNVYRCPICKQYGACVGYSGAHVLMSTPRVMNLRPASVVSLDVVSHKLYHGAQGFDQWSGGFESYEGSSVLGLMQYLRSIDAIKQYLWCRTLTEMQVAVSNYGPLQIGIDWDNNMFEPARDGTIVTGGGEAGGHAIEVIGVDFERRAFELPNTWSRDYGIEGTVFLPFTEMAKLIERRGEFALPRKYLLKRDLILP